MATAIRGDTLEQHLLTDRFRPRAHVVWVGQAGATVLLDAERGSYYTLNEVAGRTWDLLVAGEPLIEVLRSLEEEYDVPAETLRSDTAALLGRLLGADLIERMPS